jgi:hypothetical protein
MSIEPLSFDIGAVLADYTQRQGLPLEWAVIGAASRGRQTYQPNPEWTTGLLRLLDSWRVPVFFKGNLDWRPHREEFPVEDQLTDWEMLEEEQ